MIELALYDPRWPGMFQAEAGRIREADGARYVELKKSLAARHHGRTQESREEYSLGKTEFVESVIQRAFERPK